MNTIPTYRGDDLKTGITINNRFIPGYIPSKELIEAVNWSIQLERPLLIKGEPGSGKSKLAQAIAYELYRGEYEKYYFEWFIKSDTKAKDGLYRYDYLARLRDAQLASIGDSGDVEDGEKYVNWGPIGKAFKSERRCVVLIDEIDKASIDFPNDLLMELDQKKIKIEEIDGGQKEVPARHSPIVIITSNSERPLPAAFLRRCLFFKIQFPEDKLMDILLAHFPDYKDQEGLLQEVVNRFVDLREKMKRKRTNDSEKIVSTSELIDWFKLLKNNPNDQILEKLKGALPYSPALVKRWDDHVEFVLSEKRKK